MKSKITKLITTLLIFTFSITSMTAFADEKKNGLFEVTRTETYKTEQGIIKLEKKYKDYYINNEPYTGYVEFGDGVHYFKDGKSIPFLIENEKIKLFDRSGRILDNANLDVININHLYNSLKKEKYNKDIIPFSNIRFAKAAYDLIEKEFGNRYNIKLYLKTKDPFPCIKITKNTQLLLNAEEKILHNVLKEKNINEDYYEKEKLF